MARQREVSDGGTSNVSEPESLRKTHLALGWCNSTSQTTLPQVYRYSLSASTARAVCVAIFLSF
jgi:hypothetical protein